jgi:hypothetical protein
MAEFVLPPEMEAFAEAAGDAAMGPFQAADFNADPSAAFSEGMGAAMDFMSDAGMPPDMMNMIQDICQGGFDAHMAANPDSSPMDAFDAVGGAVDMYLADFPADMPCMDMMDAGMPPMPPDMGEFMDTCPPYGDFPGGDNFDAANMPDTWEAGPMTDMGPGGMGPDGPPPGDMGPGGMGPDGPPPGMDMDGDGMPPPPPGGEGPDPLFGEGGPAGGPPPGDMPPGDPMGQPGPMDGGPGAPGDMPPPGDMADMQSHMDDAGAHQGPEGPPPGDPGPMPGDMPADMPPPPDDPNDGGEVV